MSIFKRNDPGNVQQASPEANVPGGHSEQPATLIPPFVPPGVVPPPAAPMYSMRHPESGPQVEGDTVSLVAERVRSAREAQQSAQDRVRVAVQRARTSTSAATVTRRRAPQQAAPARAVRPDTGQAFDPLRAAQTGLLNLAWSWQESGAPIRAIHTYMELLHRYPDTPAADAAVADLVELSDKLADEGQFHTALAIYDQLERLL